LFVSELVKTSQQAVLRDCVMRCLLISAGLARSRWRDALTSEEHRRGTEGDVVTTHAAARRHQPDHWEDHVSWKLPQQPPWPATCQLSHDTGPAGWDEGAVSAGQRWSVGTYADPHWG